MGRTRFCIHPKAEIRQIPSVGGTKEVKYERIRELQPDCILAVKEENTLEIVETLAKEFPVFVLDVENRAEALQMITDIGEITHTQVESQALRQQIQSKWASIANIVSAKRSLYFIWKNPYMLAGKDTFIQDVMAHIGLHNLALPLCGQIPRD